MGRIEHRVDRRDASWDYSTVILCILLLFLPLVFSSSPIGPLAPFFGAKIQLLEVSFIVLFPLYFFIASRRKNLRLTFPPGSLFFLGFIAVCFVSSLLSINPYKSLIDTLGFFYLLMLLFFFYKLLDDRRNIIVSIRAFLVISTLVALFGFLAYWAYMIFGYQTFAVEVVHDFLGMESVRVNSTFVTCNLLIIYLGFALVVALSFLGSQEKRIYKILSFSLIVMSCSFILTGLYRGAFIIWGILFFGTRDFKKAKWVKTLRGAFLGLTVLFFSLFLLQGYASLAPAKINYNPMIERFGISVSTKPSVYAELHKAAVKITLDYPILGVGPGLYNSYMVIPKYGFDFVSQPFRGLDPHSTYFGYAAETGVLGVFFLILFYWRIYKTARTAAMSRDYIRRRLGGLFAVYLPLLLIYAFFIDIVTVRVLYFAYALISVLPDQPGTSTGDTESQVG